MDSRLPTHIWVAALLRRAQLAGAGAFVLSKGDAQRGDVLLKVARLDGTAAAYVPRTDMDGRRVFLDLASQGLGPDEADVDAYVARSRDRDPDLWVVEIEDRDGNTYLTEPIQRG